MSTRSTYDIVWGCFVTIFACVWSSAHPNIPAPRDSGWTRLKRRIIIMLYALIAPEMVVFWALRQNEAASKIASDYNAQFSPPGGTDPELKKTKFQRLVSWTLNILCYPIKALKQWCTALPESAEERVYGQPWTQSHGFFIQMGGFLLFEDGMASQVLDYERFKRLSANAEIEVPLITEGDIKDRSKGDAISKGFVVLQTTWFVVQCIARAAMHLPLCELEFVTLGFAALNGIVYGVWWNKPQSLNTAVCIKKKELSHAQCDSPRDTVSNDDASEAISTDDTPSCDGEQTTSSTNESEGVSESREHRHDNLGSSHSVRSRPTHSSTPQTYASHPHVHSVPDIIVVEDKTILCSQAQYFDIKPSSNYRRVDPQCQPDSHEPLHPANPSPSAEVANISSKVDRSTSSEVQGPVILFGNAYNYVHGQGIAGSQTGQPLEGATLNFRGVFDYDRRLDTVSNVLHFANNASTYAVHTEHPRRTRRTMYQEPVGISRPIESVSNVLHFAHSGSVFAAEEEYDQKRPPIWRVAAGIYRFVHPVIKPLMKMMVSDKVKAHALRMPMFYADPIASSTWTQNVGPPLIGIIFGVLHLLAWSATFPTPTERTLWRISATWITTVPVFLMILVGANLFQYRSLRDFPRIHKFLLFIEFSVSVALISSYVAARFALLVLALVALRDLPPGAHAGVAWTSFIPHF